MQKWQVFGQQVKFVKFSLNFRYTSGPNSVYLSTKVQLISECECNSCFYVLIPYSLKLLILSCFFFSEAVAFLIKSLEKIYIATRFNTDKNTWPPQQSRHFTTLAFIYHKNERTQREVITIAKASQSGHIDDIMQAAGDCDFSSEDYDLEGSRTTKDISELLAPLDHPDDCQSQTILIEGAPGIGKSFLLKHIAHLWGKKLVLTSSKLLFLVCLRDPAVQKMSSLNDLVDYFCKHEKATSNLRQICAEHLYETGGKDVTILLDGLDEFPEELHDSSFIAYILEHRVLPDCNVIVSSRPHASAHLHNNVRLRVDILGFTEKDRECFIKQSLSGRPEKIKKLLAYLQNHPTINSLCFIPFIMTVLVFLYNHEFVLFDNTGELYKQFVCLTIRRHLTKLGLAPRVDISDLNKLPNCCNDVIRDLSTLSFKALSKNQLIFTLDEIKSVCPKLEDVPEAINGFGLLQVVEHFGATHTTMSFNFIHYSIQEFLAAHCVANMPPEEEFQALENHFWSKRYYNMFSMYIGLTKGQQSPFRKFLADGDTQTRIADKFLTEQKKCLYLYKCFFEAGDNEMCQYISEANVFAGRSINLRGMPLLPTDVSCLGLFLSTSHIKQWKRLELLSCNIRDVGCRILHHALYNSSVTIENLHMSANSLTSVSANYISDIVASCKSTLLYLNGNSLGNTDGLSKLLQGTDMVELYIHRNKLHTRSVISLFKMLQTCSSNLKMLSLMHNDIHDEASVEIAATLQVNKTLECLWINGNPLSEEAALTIVASLSENNTLRLLKLPYYSYKLHKNIIREAKDINKVRRSQGCYVELNIDFQ